jgi:hypothetical protein
MCTVLLPPGGYPTAVNKYINYLLYWQLISGHHYPTFLSLNEICWQETSVGPKVCDDVEVSWHIFEFHVDAKLRFWQPCSWTFGSSGTFRRFRRIVVPSPGFQKHLTTWQRRWRRFDLSKIEEILAKWHGVSRRGTESRFQSRLKNEWWCLKVMSVRPSVGSDGTAQIPLDGFSWNFIFGIFTEIWRHVLILLEIW